jgi:hypothetical protein
MVRGGGQSMGGRWGGIDGAGGMFRGASQWEAPAMNEEDGGELASGRFFMAQCLEDEAQLEGIDNT